MNRLQQKVSAVVLASVLSLGRRLAPVTTKNDATERTPSYAHKTSVGFPLQGR